jgi:NAD(P)-dependent dehydrogenase (short-subunit alcohol dehydrogenase family)
MANRWSGKTAIVTGSARGIGAAIAQHLAAEQANVIVNYVNDKSKISNARQAWPPSAASELPTTSPKW